MILKYLTSIYQGVSKLGICKLWASHFCVWEGHPLHWPGTLFADAFESHSWAASKFKWVHVFTLVLRDSNLKVESDTATPAPSKKEAFQNFWTKDMFGRSCIGLHVLAYGIWCKMLIPAFLQWWSVAAVAVAAVPRDSTKRPSTRTRLGANQLSSTYELRLTLWKHVLSKGSEDSFNIMHHFFA